MIKKALANWKTTSAGLTLIAGSLVTLGFAINNKVVTETVVTTSVFGIIGGVGFIFAGDAGAPPLKP